VRCSQHKYDFHLCARTPSALPSLLRPQCHRVLRFLPPPGERAPLLRPPSACCCRRSRALHQLSRACASPSARSARAAVLRACAPPGAARAARPRQRLPRARAAAAPARGRSLPRSARSPAQRPLRACARAALGLAPGRSLAHAPREPASLQRAASLLARPCAELGGDERVRERGIDAAASGRRKPNRRRTEREEGEIGFPKDLCANLENCRDLSIKYKFHINLKP
jgi:hypothetical protein